MTLKIFLGRVLRSSTANASKIQQNKQYRNHSLLGLVIAALAISASPALLTVDPVAAAVAALFGITTGAVLDHLVFKNFTVNTDQNGEFTDGTARMLTQSYGEPATITTQRITLLYGIL